MKNERNNLPQPQKGWVHTRLTDIAEFLRGISYKKNIASKEPKNGFLPILRANNIGGTINFDNLVYVPLENVKDEQLIRKHDIILAMSSGSKHLVGKAAQILQDYHGSFGTFCGLVRVTSQLDRRFIGFFFQSPDYKKTVTQLSSGINIYNLRRNHIESLLIPFPSLSEQHRIVTKIEELFTKLDAGIESLKKTQTQLNRYRQAVLEAAVEGKLTKEWRKIHKGESEPASLFLREIREERKEKLGIKYKELLLSDTADLPELPEGWSWAPLEMISEPTRNITYGVLKPGPYIPNGIPLFRIIDIEAERISIENVHRISNELSERYKRTVLKGGECLISLVGTIGRVAYVDNKFKNSNIHRNLGMIAPCKYVFGKFLCYCLSSPIIQSQIREVTTGANQPLLNLRNLKQILVPIMSMAEQKWIVMKLERILTILKNMENQIDAGLKFTNKLQESILKNAFSGRLVPQDPSDEPAEKLLERIREEKSNRKSDLKQSELVRYVK